MLTCFIRPDMSVSYVSYVCSVLTYIEVKLFLTYLLDILYFLFCELWLCLLCLVGAQLFPCVKKALVPGGNALTIWTLNARLPKVAAVWVQWLLKPVLAFLFLSKDRFVTNPGGGYVNFACWCSWKNDHFKYLYSALKIKFFSLQQGNQY